MRRPNTCFPNRRGRRSLLATALIWLLAPIVPLVAVETRRGGPATSVRQIDLYVEEPLPTEGCTAEDVPRLMEAVRVIMTQRLQP